MKQVLKISTIQIILVKIYRLVTKIIIIIKDIPGEIRTTCVQQVLKME